MVYSLKDEFLVIYSLV